MFVVFAISCSCVAVGQSLRHQFGSRESIASAYFPLEQLGPDMPADWEAYEYLVLEIRSSSAQRFLLGIDTDNGLHEKRTHIFPKVWVRLSVPLDYFRSKPEPSRDLAATVNRPLTVGFMHIEGGTVGPLTGVKGLSLRMYTPIGDPEIEIRSVSLAVDDPGNAYLGTTPYVDEFGQWTLSDFEGKVSSLEELRQQWRQEEASLKAGDFGYSQYGGYLRHKVEATGFFRVEKIDDRWWFVDPQGCLFLSLGIDGIRAGGGGSYSAADGLEGVFAQAPPPPTQDGRGRSRYMSFGEQNLRLRHGDDWLDQWRSMTLRRMDAWGLNTLANGSDSGLQDSGRKAFLMQLRIRVPSVLGLQDVYAPQFEQNVEDSLRETCTRYRDNPWLIGYFVGNEPAWLEQEPRICGLILSGDETSMKAALQQYLRDGDTPQRRRDFVFRTFRTYLETVDRVMEKCDPHHLNLGIRFGHANPPADEILAVCKEVFDVFSFNTYRLAPNVEYMNVIAEKTGLPMILGEYHFGTIDRGMAPGLVQVADQQERAVAFRYFTEHAFSHPSLIGTGWFQYSDQGLTGRRDGERYNIGIVDVTDRPYPIVQGIIQAAQHIYDVHAGTIAPTTRVPRGVRGNEDDLKSVSNQ
jgi:hypothetical protein